MARWRGVIVLLFFLPGLTFAARGDMTLADFLSQSNTPVRSQWQKSEPLTLSQKISDDPSYKAMQAYQKAKASGQGGAQGTYDYWEQFGENYHSWDFCPYENTRIGEYLPPEEVIDRCCVCNNGWQCQFESRNVQEGDEYRQCLSPDIALQNFVVSAVETIPGTYLADVSFTAKNIGSGPSQDFAITLFVDETEIGSQTFAGLGVQAFTTLTSTDLGVSTTDLEFASGDYVFRAEANLIDDFDAGATDIFTDPDETNNIVEQTLSVSAPDITVSDITLTPQNDVVGQTQKHIVTTTLQNLGSPLAQAVELALIQVDATGTETTLITENHTVFGDQTLTEHFIDTTVYLPFGSYLLRAKITPQQYDEDPANNLYEETVSVVMPTFTPVALASVAHSINEQGVLRTLVDGETLLIQNGVTDPILVQAKTNLLADVTVDWQAVDSQGTIVQPYATDVYDTSVGHGARFEFDSPGTYAIQGSFTDQYNNNNTATFDLVSVVVQAAPTPPTTPTTYIESGSVGTQTFTHQGSVSFIPGSGLMQFDFTVKHPYGSNASLSGSIDPLFVTTGQTPLGDGSGHTWTFFFLGHSIPTRTYTLSSTIQANGQSISLPDFVFNTVVNNTITETSFASVYNGDIFNGTPFVFGDSISRITSPNTKTTFCLDTSHQNAVTVSPTLTNSSGNTLTLAGMENYDFQYGHCWFYTNLAADTYTLNATVTDFFDPSNTYTKSAFNFTITAGSSLQPIVIKAFKNYTATLTHNGAINLGDSVAIYVDSALGSQLTSNDIQWEILDAQQNPMTQFTLMSTYTNFGHGVYIAPVNTGTYSVRAKLTNPNDVTNFIWSPAFSFIVQ